MTVILAILAVLGGVVFAIQGPVNTALGKRTNTMQATAVSFLGGTIVSGIICLALRQGNPEALLTAPLWTYFGGIYGAICVCVTIASMPVLGAALSMAAIMFGSLVMGTIIDSLGLFGAQALEIKPLRLAGLLIVALGILMIYIGSRKKNENEKKDIYKIVMVAVAFLSGMLGAVQTPTNASLANVVGNWEGTFISFLVGATVMIIITLVLNKGKIKPFRKAGIKPWMVTGGLFGVGGIFLGIFTVMQLGSALQVTCCMFGEIAGGMVIDNFGLIHTERVKTNLLRFLGMIIILAGQIIVTIAKM